MKTETNNITWLFTDILASGQALAAQDSDPTHGSGLFAALLQADMSSAPPPLWAEPLDSDPAALTEPLTPQLTALAPQFAPQITPQLDAPQPSAPQANSTPSDLLASVLGAASQARTQQAVVIDAPAATTAGLPQRATPEIPTALANTPPFSPTARTLPAAAVTPNTPMPWAVLPNEATDALAHDAAAPADAPAPLSNSLSAYIVAHDSGPASNGKPWVSTLEHQRLNASAPSGAKKTAPLLPTATPATADLIARDSTIAAMAQPQQRAATAELQDGLTSEATPEPIGSSPLEGQSSQDSTPHGQSQSRGESTARVLLDATGQASSASTEASSSAPSFADALGDAMGQGLDYAFEQLGDQVSIWAAGQTRKANLVLETGLREALEVDISVNGDMAELVFRTDDEQTREALKDHAPALLNDMLAAAGLGLSSLSVADRNAGQSDASPNGGQDRSEQAPSAPAEPTAEPAQRLASWQGLGLSVYA